MNRRKKFIALCLTALCGISFAACGVNSSSATSIEAKAQSQDTQTLLKATPPPQYSYSQERQDLKNIEDARANATQTTSFFYNMGSNTPVFSCPSIGYPIASDTELTNPNQITWVYTGGGTRIDGVIGNPDPTGVYTGQSTGTYVICVNSAGQGYGFYWEGFVAALPGYATIVNGQIQFSGSPTAHFSTKQGG